MIKSPPKFVVRLPTEKRSPDSDYHQRVTSLPCLRSIATPFCALFASFAMRDCWSSVEGAGSR
jgi:hypothetical protein